MKQQKRDYNVLRWIHSLPIVRDIRDDIEKEEYTGALFGLALLLLSIICATVAVGMLTYTIIFFAQNAVFLEVLTWLGLILAGISTLALVGYFIFIKKLD